MTMLEEPPAVLPPVSQPPVGPVDDPSQDVPRNITSKSIDDRATLWGSAAASLAFVWVVYENILAFSGIIGFIVAWWFVFLAFYAGVTALAHPIPAVIDKLAGAVISSGAVIVYGVLASAVGYVFYEGFPAYRHPNFFTQTMAGVRTTAPLTHGGIWHAIVGTAEQVGIATVISLPLGIGTAIFLAEVGGPVAKVVRTVVEAMTALPDILAGLFVYTVLIITLHHQRNGLAVGLALAVTMTPIVARSAEVVLRVVPGGLREASLALGASNWQTVWRVVLPTARSGLATSLILGIARVAGESAPLLIVSGANTFFNGNPFNGLTQNSLPFFIYTGIRSGEPLYETRAYGAASVLLALVLVLFIAARLAARDRLAKGGGSSRRTAPAPTMSAAAGYAAMTAPVSSQQAPQAPGMYGESPTAPIQTYIYGPDPDPIDPQTD